MTKILSDIALDQAATGAQTGTIAEPSLGCSGKRILITGNWFSSRSTDGGNNWQFVDPYTELPRTGAGFCCDQLVRYSKKWRRWIWLQQFSKDAQGNIVRIAVSATGKPGTWTWWDTSPQDVDSTWRNVWFDYPDMTETDSHLLLSFNMFSVTTDRWQRAVVIRFPMAALKQQTALTRQAWSTEQFGSLRFAKGPGATALFASLNNAAPKIEVFQWADNKSTVSQKSISISAWSDGPYASSGPGGSNWLNRLDDRITGGWIARDSVGFAWSAAADASHPHPFIRAVRLAKQSLVLIDEPDLWNSDRAWAYPAMSPNRRGDVGVSAFCGGGSLQPTHGVGWLNDKRGIWEMALGAASTHGPQNGVWGDYLDIQADPSRTTYWLASSYVLQGGSSRTNIVPRVVLFKP